MIRRRQFVFGTGAASHGGTRALQPTSQTVARNSLVERDCPRRRWLLATAVMLALPWRRVEAQVRVRSIGLLFSSRRTTTTSFPIFVETLGKLGLREGENLRFVVKESAGQFERLPALARELLEARVEMVVAFNTPGARAAVASTREVPIVFTQVGDPVGSGFVSNLSRPGGNVTGVSNMIAVLAPKRLEIFREALPDIHRLAVLYNPGDSITEPQVRDVQTSAASFGLTVRLFAVRNVAELESAFSQINAWKADAGFWLIGQDQMFRAGSVSLAAKIRLPLMLGNTDVVPYGGLLAYGTDNTEILQRTAEKVAQILKGAHPGDLPVEQPTRFVLAVNLRTARSLGIKLPQSILERADRVIE